MQTHLFTGQSGGGPSSSSSSTLLTSNSPSLVSRPSSSWGLNSNSTSQNSSSSSSSNSSSLSWTEAAMWAAPFVGGAAAVGLCAYAAHKTVFGEDGDEQRRLAAERRRREVEKRAKEEEIKMKEFANAKAKLIVYYGSQTGTAEGFAKTISEGCRRIKFKGWVRDLDDFDEEEFLAGADDTIFCFVVATYGEGDPSDNAVKFHAWLKDTSEHLTKVRYTVFGLGNRQYEHYNAMGRFVDKTLSDKGARRVYKYGEGDDDGTLEQDFTNWLEDLHEELRVVQFGDEVADGHGHTNGAEIPEVEFAFESVALAEPPHKDAAVVSSEGRVLSRATSDSARLAKIDVVSRAYFKAIPFAVKSIRELRQNPGEDKLGSTLHIDLEVPQGTTYGTAHNLSIVSENDPLMVSKVASVLGANLDEWIVMRPSNKGETRVLFPAPCTVRTALTCYCALTAIPSRALLLKFAALATDPAHRARLGLLGSKLGKVEYQSHIHDRRTSVYEILEEFPSIKVANIGNFLDICPRLVARDYTIASSVKLSPTILQLVVSLVNDPLPHGRVHKGVCTHGLERRRLLLEEGKTSPPLYALVKPSSFVMPPNPNTPIIMIGPGTGIAPMRALLQEREWQHKQRLKCGSSVLFFGCRRKNEDYIYSDELEAWQKTGVLSHLFVAFSREHPGKKVYVTNHLQEQGALVWDLVNSKGGHIYVCGGTQMGRDVSAALESVAKSQGGLDDVKAKAYVHKLVGEGKYISELWS